MVIGEEREDDSRENAGIKEYGGEGVKRAGKKGVRWRKAGKKGGE